MPPPTLNKAVEIQCLNKSNQDKRLPGESNEAFFQMFSPQKIVA